MAMETRIDKYETSDIAQAAFLFASGTNLLSINRRNPRRCIFVFDSPQPELLSKWLQGKASVNALAYHNAYQELKAKVFRGD